MCLRSRSRVGKKSRPPTGVTVLLIFPTTPSYVGRQKVFSTSVLLFFKSPSFTTIFSRERDGTKDDDDDDAGKFNFDPVDSAVIPNFNL